MTLSDNSNTLLLRRKMARRTQSQSTSTSPSIQSPIQNSNSNKSKMVKSHSDSKRMYRSNDALLINKTNDLRKKTVEETEFEEKIKQLHILKENSASTNEFNDINYFLNDEINETEKKNESSKKEFKIQKEPVSDEISHTKKVNEDLTQKKIYKETTFPVNEAIKTANKNKNLRLFREDETEANNFQTTTSENKLTNWNEEKSIPNNEDLIEINDFKNSNSILKSLNMYRF